MEKIQWTERYSVGIEAIDLQHQHLVELINKLIQANIEKQASEVLWEVLNELLDYTRVHFSDEEEFMASIGFPVQQEHQLAHYDLMKKVLKLHADFWSADAALPEETLSFLKTWLTSHIVAEDLEYARFAKKRP